MNFVAASCWFSPHIGFLRLQTVDSVSLLEATDTQSSAHIPLNIFGVEITQTTRVPAL